MRIASGKCTTAEESKRYARGVTINESLFFLFRKLVLLLVHSCIRLTSIINLCSSLSDHLLPSTAYDPLNRQLNVDAGTVSIVKIK